MASFRCNHLPRWDETDTGLPSAKQDSTHNEAGGGASLEERQIIVLYENALHLDKNKDGFISDDEAPIGPPPDGRR